MFFRRNLLICRSFLAYYPTYGISMLIMEKNMKFQFRPVINQKFSDFSTRFWLENSWKKKSSQINFALFKV